jgi:alanyl-tRNA synthetase
MVTGGVAPNEVGCGAAGFAKLTTDELKQVGDFVNARIREGIELEEKRNYPYQEAIKEGALALFGEKYGDTVRTIRFGKSMELCGGTHVPNTNEIWHFIITGETAVASGIRRIEAITGDAAKIYFIDRSETLSEVQKVLNNPKDLVSAVEKMQQEQARLQTEIQSLLKLKVSGIKKTLKQDLETVNGVSFIAKQVDLDASGMKDLAYELGSEVDNLFVLLGAELNGKALLTCYISKQLAAEKELNAGQIVRELGRYIKGGGGGQPFFATAGGKDPGGIADALEKSRSYLT